MGDEMATDRTQVNDSMTRTRFELRCLAYWIGNVTAMNLQRKQRVKHVFKTVRLGLTRKLLRLSKQRHGYESTAKEKSKILFNKRLRSDEQENSYD